MGRVIAMRGATHGIDSVYFPIGLMVVILLLVFSKLRLLGVRKKQYREMADRFGYEFMPKTPWLDRKSLLQGVVAGADVVVGSGFMMRGERLGHSFRTIEIEVMTRSKRQDKTLIEVPLTRYDYQAPAFAILERPYYGWLPEGKRLVKLSTTCDIPETHMAVVNMDCHGTVSVPDAFISTFSQWDGAEVEFLEGRLLVSRPQLPAEPADILKWIDESIMLAGIWEESRMRGEMSSISLKNAG